MPKLLLSAEQQLHTLLSAKRFGGNFIKHLVEAGLVADPLNRARIFESWPEIEVQYGPRSVFYSEDLG